MVKIMGLLMLINSVIWAGIASAAPYIKLVADKKVMVLGEPLLVKIIAEDARDSLGKINLDKLQQDFNVYAISSSAQTLLNKGLPVKSETMTLTLYPLRSGKLQLPALIYMGNKSNSLVVKVNESGKHMSPVMIRTTLDTSLPHVRQAATLTLDVYDDGNLLWMPPGDVVATGAHQRKLAQSRREEMLDGIRYTVHRHAWALMPLREGGMKVEFPMLDASKLGVRLRYPVAPLWLDVAPVPAYLPVHLPIGKIEVSSEALPAELVLERPVNWTFVVKGSGIGVEGLGKMLASIRSTDSLQFYPATITADANERSQSAMQSLRVTLPFAPLQSGVLQFPDINLPYYDTTSLRVESVFISGKRIDVFNPLWRTVQKIALWLIGLAGSAIFSYWLYKKLLGRISKRKGLIAIGRAASADELHRAILKFEIDAELSPCFTLQQWLERLKQVYYTEDNLAEVIEKLSGAKYGSAENEEIVSALSGELVRLLKNMRARKSGWTHLSARIGGKYGFSKF